MSQSSLASSGALVPSYLLQDTYHRMANSLTILAAMLRCEFNDFRDVELRQALRRCEKQIVAAGELNRLLGATWGPVDMTVDTYFRPLCALLSRTMLSPLGIRCEAFVADGELSYEKRGYLAMILVELVTNAAKHAFCGQPSSCVRIEIETVTDQWFLRVADNGRGFQHFEKGTGSTIVESLVETLGAQLTIDTGVHGTCICIKVDA